MAEVKRKRGRPKGSKNKSSVKSSESVSRKVVKRSAAKKKTVSKNPRKKAQKASTECAPKKRGRPKGSKNGTTKKTCTEYDMSNVKMGKHLGFCPKCDTSIATYDLISKFIFVCGACGKRARTNKLREDSKRLSSTERPQSKKEYMESKVNTEFHDMPAHLNFFPGSKR